jgi:KDO2-lipid IV(A) lauroyltransferase
MTRFLDLLGKIPRPILVAFGSFLGWLGWTLRIRRKVVLDNLRLAFPEKSEAERRAIGRANYRHLGQMIPDFLRVPTLSPEALDRLLVYEGWECVEAARARGKGVVACTAHFGNFDLLASANTRRGVPITQIARAMGKNVANDLIREVRRRSGVDELVVRPGQTMRAILKALKQNRVIGWTIDQNQPVHPIFPTFFGVPAATASTPAVLARKTGCAIIFTLSVPLGDGRHRVFIEGPLEVRDTGDPEADDLAFMQLLNDKLEHWVRRHPERWYWVHRRWKTRPPPPPAGPASALPPPGPSGPAAAAAN